MNVTSSHGFLGENQSAWGLKAFRRTMVRQADKVLYKVLSHIQWTGWNLAMDWQQLEMSRETDAPEVNTLETVPRIYVCWHGRFLMGEALLRQSKRLLAVSLAHRGRSAEPFFQRNLRQALLDNCRRKGFDFVEHSEHGRPGEVVEELQRRLQAGWPVWMTADSPRTGAFVARSGSLVAAAKAGVEVIPCAYSSSVMIRIHRFWDNCMVPLPLPFGRFHLRLGRPIRVPANATPEQLEAARQTLAEALNRITLDADIMAGVSPENRLKSPTARL